MAIKPTTWWYVRPALRERGTTALGPSSSGPRRRVPIGLAVLALAAGLSACGGDEERADADEPSGDFPVRVNEATFPNHQRLANATDLQLEVENIGDEQIPDLAVTIFVDDGADGPFSIRSQQPGLADPNRPVWILEENYPKVLKPGQELADANRLPPAGADVANTNTFAFGPMAPGDTKHMIWRVTPIDGGTYTVNYEIAAGLHGKARAVTVDGGPVQGSSVVTISTKPPETRVNEQGEVVTVG
jgi:hypothetical protein